MASATQVQGFGLISSRSKKSSPYRLKRPWSYGRGYVAIAGIIFVVVISLGFIHLHQSWRQWRRFN
ncbi:MAG TPA: hypothetical protein V6C84_07160 [Coleofasciculaceae cyanobacterium]